MSKQVEIEQLRSIKTLPQLIRYLRDELDWPIDQDAAEDVATFEYSLEEIGLSKDYADIIKEVKQIRPLDSKQPWGIFWVNFDKQRLPVAILRRILGNLAIKKRTKGSKSQQAAWHAHDLMFISAYGEASDRAVTFAHFSQNPENPSDLPALKVLGWDDDDTSPHLSDVHNTLKEKLRWPTNSENSDAWRKQWASAFVLGHREVITTTEDMVEELARLATAICKRTKTAIKKESEKGPLRRLHSAFKASLIHDLDEDGFADVIAQTISYGLLTARFSSPEGITVQNLVDMVPPTNPFLRELLGTFLHLAGRRSIFDFDELGIQDVVELLNNANTEAVKNDFGNRTRGEDPVIHFYEHFLSAYNMGLKVQRGVFYTPQPVVSFIVRSVHELLQTEFGLEDGLASTVTWSEMESCNTELKCPKGVEPNSAFVQILDPATGTATFLIEVIDVIYKTMMAKWQKQGMSQKSKLAAWNEYVPKYLLTRLHGYELMMAPYAIAHMKIGLKLDETGYRFGSAERARVYLTNSLEPPQDFSDRLAFDIPALAHEAREVNTIKKHQRFTVIIGNPPYSGEGRNTGEWIRGLISTYMYVDGAHLREKGKKNWLQDDYVKFIRYSQYEMDKSAIGILGFINNHGLLDNPTFRGMRESLMRSFTNIHILDLHGNTRKKERSPDGSVDENVFDIQQGVAIELFRHLPRGLDKPSVGHANLWGCRGDASKTRPIGKYGWLAQNSFSTTNWTELSPSSPLYLLIPQDTELRYEYETYYKLTEMMPLYGAGIITARDHFIIDFHDGPLRQRLEQFRDLHYTDEWIRKNLEIEDNSMWSMAEARREFKNKSIVPSLFLNILYRPFDRRRIYFETNVVFNMRIQIMRHMIEGKNLGLCTNRQVNGEFHHVGVTRNIISDCTLSLATRERTNLFPVWIFPDKHSADLLHEAVPRPNLSLDFLKILSHKLQLRQVGNYALPQSLEPEDIFHYTYAVLHSPFYRRRYAEFLKSDFPRLPLASSLDLFNALSKLGAELTDLHLLESLKLDKNITRIVGDTKTEIEKVAYSNQTVWIDKAETVGFKGVPEIVWDFHIGGYQVCEKWLKDRKGRKLTKDDIEHYQKIVVALNETIRIMAEIDKVIDRHGGWPGAFADKKLKK